MGSGEYPTTTARAGPSTPRSISERQFLHGADCVERDRLTDRRVASYVLKLVGLAILVLLLGVLGVIVFSGVWVRVGFLTAIFTVFGILFVLGWVQDSKERRKRM